MLDWMLWTVSTDKECHAAETILPIRRQWIRSERSRLRCRLWEKSIVGTEFRVDIQHPVLWLSCRCPKRFRQNAHGHLYIVPTPNLAGDDCTGSQVGEQGYQEMKKTTELVSIDLSSFQVLIEHRSPLILLKRYGTNFPAGASFVTPVVSRTYLIG